jgi:hypothetical protein
LELLEELMNNERRLESYQNDNLNWVLLTTENNIDVPLQRNVILPYFGIGYYLVYNASISNINMISTNGLLGPNSAVFINKKNDVNICSDFITIDIFKLERINTFS